MSQNVPKLRPLARQHKVIELRAQGKTIADISKELDVSEKTVDRDLKSQTIIGFTDELIRQQIIDINTAEELPLRLQFRSDLLDKLLPKKSEIKTDATAQIDLNTPVNELIQISREAQCKLKPNEP